jgi:putative tricarboxylic transport membrane protein
VTQAPEPFAEASGPDSSSWSISSRRGELCAATALVLVGIFFVWQSASLKFGSIEQPGPGFLPMVFGLVLSALASVIALSRWRQPAEGEAIMFGHRDVWLAFPALIALPILFERLGAYATLGSFMAVLLVLIGRVSPVLAIAASAAAMLAVWGFFQVLLGVRLPPGFF